MNIKTRLYLISGLILFLLLIYVGTTFYFFTASTKKIEQLIQLEIIEEYAFELEINVNEHASAVFHFARFHDDPGLERVEDSQLDLTQHLLNFLVAVESDMPELDVAKLIGIDQRHVALGNAIVLLVQQLKEELNGFYETINAIDKLIDEELQPGVESSDSEVIVKLEAVLDMEINVGEAFIAIGGYALFFDSVFLAEMADAEADFNRFLQLYRDTTLTTDEALLLDLIEKSFRAALKQGDSIVTLTNELNLRHLAFERELIEADRILDDEIQTVVHSEIISRSAAMIDFSKSIKFILIISSSIVFLLISIIVILLSKKILNSISGLSVGAEQFKQGNLDYQIDVTSRDELSMLAESFNDMAKNLDSTTTSRDNLLKEIATRKIIEDELILSKARFAGILDIAREAIISVDETQTIIIFNKGAEAIFGYEEKEVLGKPLDFLIPKKSRKTHRVHIKNFSDSDAITRRMGDSKDIFGLHRSGTIFPAEATISKIFSNGVLILTVILRDISERKKIEQQLQGHTDELEHAVKQKTKEMKLLSERMIRQEKLATVGKISGNIAHELRNPMGAIKQSVYFLRRLLGRKHIEAFSDKMETSLELIDHELDAANNVITNMLDVTRSKTIMPAMVDLESMVTKLVKDSMIDRLPDISYQLEPDPFLVFVDQEQFRQVIINLLNNVVQNNEKDPHVTFSAIHLADDKMNVIRLEDNGPGIDPQIINKIFEPLFTTRDMGTGLGLSICQQIIERHGGTITVQNTEKQNTIVEIKLPMQKPPT